MQQKMFGETALYSENWTWIYFPWNLCNINGTEKAKLDFPIA